MENKIIDIAIIEVFSWTPHIGTAYEIAVREKKEGKNVQFFFILNLFPEETDGKYDLEYINKATHRITELQHALLSYNVPLHIYSAIDKVTHFENEVSSIFKDMSNLSLDEISDYKYSGFDIGKGLRSSLISMKNDNNVKVIDFESEVKLLLNNSLLVNEEVKHMKK